MNFQLKMHQLNQLKCKKNINSGDNNLIHRIRMNRVRRDGYIRESVDIQYNPTLVYKQIIFILLLLIVLICILVFYLLSSK